MSFGKAVGIIAFVISLYILWRIQQILLIAFAALVFATVINRLVRFLERFVAKRGIAVFISIIILIILLAGFIWIVVPPFVAQVQQLIDLTPLAIEQSRNWLDWLRSNIPEGMADNVPTTDTLITQIQPFVARFFRNFFAFFTDLLTILGSALLVLILTVMFLVNPQLYRRIFLQLFPSFYRRRAEGIMNQSEVALVNWAIGVLINTAFIGTISAIGLWILGVPLILANSFIAGFLEVIPNLGPTLSLIPPVLVALTDGVWKAVGVVILYLLIQQIENYLLVPFVMKKTVLLPPVVTLLSQIVFAVFFGVLALFLALPFVVVAEVWLQEVLVKDILDQWGADKRNNRPEPIALVAEEE
ncbi:MAG: AI-2E family transporter [Kastovskya adunca ATA6-11-RM4]|nr:AI-2E family transporter [Kastovskya adunca ATA6-11-RM4]